MSLSPLNPGIAQSLWRDKNDGLEYIGPERDSQRCLEPFLNDAGKLRDPPTAFESIGEPAELVEGEAGVTDDLAALAEQAGLQRTEAARERQAPSKTPLNSNVNTIEIVKKGGAYYVVFDGVAQTPVSHGDASPQRYWMPRFREKLAGATTPRSLQPVLVSMRLEEYEIAPASCVLYVKQRVVHKKRVAMKSTTVLEKQLTPNNVSSQLCECVSVDYPVVSTPMPYFGINDYNYLRCVESTIAVPLKALEWASKFVQKTAAQTGNIANASLSGFTLQAAYNAFVGVQSYTGWLASGYAYYFSWAPGATTAAELATGAATMTTLAGVAASVLTVSLIYKLYRDMQATGLPFKVDKESNKDLLERHKTLCSQEPVTHTITLEEFPDVIMRLAETRSNGSLIDGTGETLGKNTADLSDMGWKRESALLDYLTQIADTDRALQRDDAEDDTSLRPSDVTGRYSITQNLKHNEYVTDNQSKIKFFTNNTIDRTGLDRTSLANTRTEFAYEIQITEHDGSKLPLIRVDPTRTNGIDAGWIAAGHDELVEKCRKAIDVFDARLKVLPGLGYFVARGKRIVGDGSAKDVYHLAYDYARKQYFTEKATEEAATSSTDTEQEKQDKERRKEAEKIKAQNEYESKKKDAENAKERVRKANTDITENKDAQRSLARKHTAKLTDIRDNNRLSDAEKRKRTREATKKYNEDLDKLKTRMNNFKQALSDAYVKQETAARDEASALVNKKTVDGKRRYLDLFDYDVAMSRLRNCIVGAGYCEDEKSVRASSVATRKTEAVASKADSAAVDTHVETCRRLVAASLSVEPARITDDSSFLLRFIDTFAPFPGVKIGAHRRFEEFVVPRALQNKTVEEVENEIEAYRRKGLDPPANLQADLAYAPKAAKQILEYALKAPMTRVLPQFVAISTHNTASVQREEISSLISRGVPLASVNHARRAFKRLRDSANDSVKNSEILIGPLGCHFAQRYSKTAAWSPECRDLGTPVSLSSTTLDLVATSSLPSNNVVAMMRLAEEAGSRSYARILELAGGKTTRGMASVLKGMGAAPSLEALSAAAVFSEVFTFEALDRGAAGSFELERLDLLQSSLGASRQACSFVATFLLDYLVKREQSVGRVLENDVAFFALPGMAYTRVALRALGSFAGVRPADNLVEVNKQSAQRFCNALSSISGSKKIPLALMPFTCVQSVLATLPRAVQSLEGFANVAVESHTIQLAFSFERVHAALRDFRPRSNVKCAVLVDLVASRPVVLKAFSASPDATANLIARSSVGQRQRQWSRPATYTSEDTLAVRMAALRTDIEEEYLSKPAVAGGAAVREQLKNSYDDLVQDLLHLDLRRKASVESYKSATFLVPFGALLTGSVRDLPHQSFEMQPVWIEGLRVFVREARSDALTTAVSADAHPRIVPSKTTREQAAHPYEIVWREGNISVHLESFDNDVDASVVVPPQMPDSLAELLERVLNTQTFRDASGKLSQIYRRVMHNSERMMQANLLMAAQLYHKSKQGLLQASFSADSTQNANLAVGCACVANCIAASLTGSFARISVQTAQDPVAFLRSLERMCDVLIDAGVVAMPFVEVCMVLGAVS